MYNSDMTKEQLEAAEYVLRKLVDELEQHGPQFSKGTLFHRNEVI